MELFSHRAHVTDEMRERLVRSLGAPELQARFERYRGANRTEASEGDFDRALAPHVLKYIERARRVR
jgi:hypothetical protein